MSNKVTGYLAIILLFSLAACNESAVKNKAQSESVSVVKDTVKSTVEEVAEQEEKFELTEDNAIDFFFDYQKNLKVNRVRLTTNMGSFTVQLFDNVPYHKANFIYLSRQGYFDYTMFHRVVKGFIIQGGNADNKETARKRRAIGKYLLPPDTRKGYKHHRGTLSMPSSEIDNPHMLASPFEFFIVVTDPGSYHLDGNYTPFGKVIQGMDVVDKINNVAVDSGDWPKENVYIEKAEVLE